MLSALLLCATIVHLSCGYARQSRLLTTISPPTSVRLWVLSGGEGGRASGGISSVSGGESNTASGFFAVVSGGVENTTSGDYASVSGGRNRSAPGQDDWAAGPLFADN